MKTIERLRELLDKATPGVWECRLGNETNWGVGVVGTNWGVEYPAQDGTICSLNDREYIENTNKHDGELIAAMRNAIPALLEVVTAANALNNAIRDLDIPEYVADEYLQELGNALAKLDEASADNKKINEKNPVWEELKKMTIPNLLKD